VVAGTTPATGENDRMLGSNAAHYLYFSVCSEQVFSFLITTPPNKCATLCGRKTAAYF